MVDAISSNLDYRNCHMCRRVDEIVMETLCSVLEPLVYLVILYTVLMKLS